MADTFLIFGDSDQRVVADTFRALVIEGVQRGRSLRGRALTTVLYQVRAWEGRLFFRTQSEYDAWLADNVIGAPSVSVDGAAIGSGPSDCQVTLQSADFGYEWPDAWYVIAQVRLEAEAAE
jgi:hypothetical protein